MARIEQVPRFQRVGAAQIKPEVRSRSDQQTGAVSRNPCRSGSRRCLSCRAIGADPEIAIQMIGL